MFSFVPFSRSFLALRAVNRFSYSAAHGVKKICLVITSLIVSVLTISHSRTITMENILLKTLEKVLGNSFAICVVEIVNTPSGNVSPY